MPRRVAGHTEACTEGYRENSEAIQEILYNDLMSNTRYQARLMGMTSVTGDRRRRGDKEHRIVPLNLRVSTFALLQAKLHGLTVQVAPPMGLGRHCRRATALGLDTPLEVINRETQTFVQGYLGLPAQLLLGLATIKVA